MIGRGLTIGAATKLASRSLGDPALADMWGGADTHAGPRVDEQKALTLPALFRGLDNLSSHLAMLPLPVFRWIGPGERERDSAHRVQGLLNREPNPDMTAFAFRKALHLHTMLWGNGIAEIERVAGGGPRYLWSIVPGMIDAIDRDATTGELLYRILRDGADRDTVRGDNIIHVAGMSYDGIIGYPLIRRLACENVGLALAINQFAQSFFGNNTILGTVLSAPGKLDPDQRRENIEAWNNAGQGSGKAFRAVMMDGGMKVEHLAHNNESSQTVELLTYSVQDIARWLNVPPPMLMELSNGTFTNTTELGRWYVAYGLGSWFEPYEQEFNRKLFTPEEQSVYFVELVAEGLLRGDIKTRYEAYVQGLTNGFLCPDEVRAWENLNPLPDGLGKVFRVPLNMAPIDEANSRSLGAGSPESSTNIRRQIAGAHRVLFYDAFSRMDKIAARAGARARKTKTTPAELELWADKFFAEHATTVRTALAPCVEALGGALRATLTTVILDAEWDRFIGEYTKLLTEFDIKHSRLRFDERTPLVEDDDCSFAADDFVRLAVEKFGGSDD